MTKRPLETDEASQLLIDTLQDEDEITTMRLKHTGEHSAIDAEHVASLETLRDEFQTLDPETLEDRQALRLKQKLEFENGLHMDRISALEVRIEADKEKRVVSVEQRTKRRHIDRTLNDCKKVASLKQDGSCYKTIGKNRHLQHVLEGVKDNMTTHQREQYATVMQDLKKNGWKVFIK